MRSSSSLSSIIFKRHSLEVGAVEESSGELDNLVEDNSLHVSASDIDSVDHSALGQGVLGPWLHEPVEKVVGETKDMGELVGKGTEQQELVQWSFFQESQVEDIGSDGGSVVHCGEVARGGSSEIVSALIILRVDGNKKINWGFERWNFVVIALSSSETESLTKVNCQMSLEIISNTLNQSDNHFVSRAKVPISRNKLVGVGIVNSNSDSMPSGRSISMANGFLTRSDSFKGSEVS